MIPALLVAVGVASAAPEVRIEASVDPELRVVRGTMTVVGLEGASWVDPLASLPIPSLEIAHVRTWPGRPERGSVVWEQEGCCTLTFEARLPHRWEDLGWTRRHGLFANGSWYPQPIVDGTLPVVHWQVDVDLPPETTGALGDSVGRGHVRWDGFADRASLAVKI